AFFDRRTAAAPGCRHGIYTQSAPGVETEVEAAPIVPGGDRSGRPPEAAHSALTSSDIATIASARVCADFLFDADEVAAPRTVLRRKYADATAVSDLIDRVENIHHVEAHSHRLMIRHIEIARHSDIELRIRR